jgi:NADH-quinone oxidoreductase subunit A
MTALYLPLFALFALALAASGGMWLAGAWLGPRHPTPEKLLPYECGNDTDGARRPVGAKFYLVAILFVVFDLEGAMILPWAALFRSLGWAGLVSMAVFTGALLVALVYAWKKGALEWQD